VWLVPLGELAKAVPPQFPPEEYLEQGAVPTGMGRLSLTFLNCGEGGAGALRANHHEGDPPALGLLAVRVAPKDASLVADHATPLYALQVYARGAGLRQVLSLGGFAVAVVDAQDGLSSLPAAGLPSYDMALQADDGSSVASHLQGASSEAYDRLFRSFHAHGDAISAMDLLMNSTLWEATGTIRYSDASAIAKFLPAPFQADTDYHILVDVDGEVRAATLPGSPREAASHGGAAR
jgi:hypothetical protein